MPYSPDTATASSPPPEASPSLNNQETRAFIEARKVFIAGLESATPRHLSNRETVIDVYTNVFDSAYGSIRGTLAEMANLGDYKKWISGEGDVDKLIDLFVLPLLGNAIISKAKNHITLRIPDEEATQRNIIDSVMRNQPNQESILTSNFREMLESRKRNRVSSSIIYNSLEESALSASEVAKTLTAAAGTTVSPAFVQAMRTHVIAPANNMNDPRHNVYTFRTADGYKSQGIGGSLFDLTIEYEDIDTLTALSISQDNMDRIRDNFLDLKKAIEAQLQKDPPPSELQVIMARFDSTGRGSWKPIPYSKSYNLVGRDVAAPAVPAAA